MDRISASSAIAARPGSRSQRSSLCLPSLLDERFDHDSCSVGFVASVNAVASHTVLQQALTALERLAHRGAVAADGKSSDGVGLMTAVPRKLLLDAMGLRLEQSQALGVGMLFLRGGRAKGGGG